MIFLKELSAFTMGGVFHYSLEEQKEFRVHEHLLCNPQNPPEPATPGHGDRPPASGVRAGSDVPSAAQRSAAEASAGSTAERASCFSCLSLLASVN